jgi:hypothetical protein
MVTFKQILTSVTHVAIMATLIVFAVMFSKNDFLYLNNTSNLYLTGLVICFLIGYFFEYYSRIGKETAHSMVAILSTVFLLTLHVLLLIKNPEFIEMLSTTGFNSMDILVWAALVLIGWQQWRTIR